MKDNYSETFQTWNKIAPLYQDKFMNLDLYNETYDYICSHITKFNAKILEIGCGPGNITKYLLSKRPDFNIFGIDVAPNMIELARENNAKASFAIMDCRKIDEIRNNYDGIICGFCLPYLSQSDVKKFIADCHSLLNENGLLYLSFVEGNPESSGFQTGSTGDKVYFYFHNLESITTQLAENGLSKLETFNVSYNTPKGQSEIHTIIVAQKKSILPIAN